MINKKKLNRQIDVDLDVTKALEKFPDNDNEAYVFLRSELNPKDGSTESTFLLKGEYNTLAVSLYHILLTHEDFRNAVLDASANILVRDEELMKQFTEGCEYIKSKE